MTPRVIERESLCLQLLLVSTSISPSYQEELEAQQRRKEELDMRKKLEDRVEMLRAYEHSKAVKEERRVKEEAEELAFREKLLKKFAEDDRVELLNEHKKRMKVQVHKREVERLIQVWLVCFREMMQERIFWGADSSLWRIS